VDVLVWCAARGIPLYGPTGASAHLRGLSRALLSRGHRVRVATPQHHDERGRHEEAPPLPSVHLPRGRWPVGLRSAGARLDGHLLALRAMFPRPELLWERHTLGSRAASRWARVLGLPRWVELNAPLALEVSWPDPPRPARLREEHALLRSAERVLAVSRWLADWAVAEVGCAPDRVVHLPNGVEQGRPGERERVRQALGLTGPVVGFLGSMSAWQGADRLPQLLDALGPDWTGLALGGGPVAPAGHPRLIQLGRIASDELPDYVSAFDVAVAPYLPGAPPWFCPLKVLWYRAQGVPVVGSPLGDVPALVGQHGLLAWPEPTGDWVEAVRAALSLPRQPRVRTWEDVVDEALSC
jgi:glycosyltransferase involved in cell wall biosynthesis